MHRGRLVPLSLALGAMLALATPAMAQVEVDLELVLAVDISRSMDYDEQQLQRDGYVEALRHPEVIAAIQSGPIGRIAITYVEWAGPFHQAMVVPWTFVSGAAEAEAFAARVAEAPAGPRTRHLDLAGPRFRVGAVRVERRERREAGDRRLGRRAQQHGPAGGAGPRSHRRRRHHHQRPADHAEDELCLRPLQHPQSRRLLRGLRHRRPGGLHDHGRRSGPVRHRHPAEAGARDRRDDAGAEADEGRGAHARSRGSIA